MALLTTPIPNLIGGVSQQPPSIRQINEAQEILNAIPSPVEGLIKRPPTEHLAAVADGSGNLLYNNLADIPFVHMIERDENEKYLFIVQKNGTPSVYDLAGNRKTLYTINSLPTAENYQRSAVTIADVTFIASNVTTPAMSGTLSTALISDYDKNALFLIRQANYVRKHTVTLTTDGVTHTFNALTRTVTIDKAGTGGGDGVYQNVPLSWKSGTKFTGDLRATVEAGSAGVIYVVINTEPEWNGPVDTVVTANSADVGGHTGVEFIIKDRVSGRIGTDKVAETLRYGNTSDYVGATDIRMIATSVTTNPTAGQTVTVAANGTSRTYTFRATVSVNGEVKIGATARATLENLYNAIRNSGGVAGDYQVASAHPTVNLILIYNSVSLFGFVVRCTTPTIGVAISHTTAAFGGIEPNISQGINGIYPYTATLRDSTLRVQSTTNFSASVDDDFSGDGILFVRDEIERFEDLPISAPHGYVVKVMNSPESAIDDYYVEFVADDGVFSRGVWEETVAIGIKYEIDKSTMPLILIRQSDGTFMLKRADGTTPGTGAGRPAGDAADVYNKFKWADREVGDLETNPDPSFIGAPINAMVYHQSRLGILAGENIVMSQTSEFFNFWRTTVLDTIDTEVIDIASSNARVSDLIAAVPFNRDLILFTPTSQMIVRGTEVFSPRTVGMYPVADFETVSSKVRPVPSANSVFFMYPNGKYYGMRELVPHQNIDGSYIANDLTAQVPRYIESTAYCLAATTHDNIAVVVADTGLYCYRYANQGDQRVQSAWFKFTFNSSHPSSNTDIAKVVWAGFNESDLYVLVHRTRNNTTAYMTIEKIRMGSGLNDTATTGKNWVTHLDQRKLISAKSYNSTTGRTTLTLHAPLSYSPGKTRVVTGDGYTLPIVAGTNYNISTGAAGTVEVNGDYTAVNTWVGTNYTMTYQFSTPYIRARAGQGTAAMLTGRYQLRNVYVQYADTGYFNATVTMDDGTSYEYPFTGEILGLAVIGNINLDTGTFKIPVLSRNDGMVLKITNDSPFPCKLLSADIEAYYNDRANRYSP